MTKRIITTNLVSFYIETELDTGNEVCFFRLLSLEFSLRKHETKNGMMWNGYNLFIFN